MYYYEVRVAGRAYHSKKPLTYQSVQKIKVGTIVSIPVRNKKLTGFVLAEVDKPSFTSKDIARISTEPPLSRASLDLYSWMESYYPVQSSATLQLFLPNTILKKKSTETDEILQTVNTSTPPELRIEQKKVLNAIKSSNERRFLLHGETGSGKTRVYAELVNKALADNLSALILTPEIGLTAQLVRQLTPLVKSKVVIIHSQLTPKQKRQSWEKIASSKAPLTIVGTRSALFAPFSKLGLVVVDEAHEDAYKQDQAPWYHASSVAAQLATIHEAKLVLGSATPSVVDYEIFSSKKLPILSMQKTSGEEQTITSSIIDLKDRTAFASSPYLSTDLIKSIKSALNKNEQSLIYLNRRGTARLVLCQKCGWENNCPNCDIALTFHDDVHEMRCHTCGHTDTPPSRCPVCSSPDIYYKQIGTKSLLSHIQKLFPEAKTARFDTDLTKDTRLEARYESVHNGEIDILVGTQLLGKGLDLPKLSVVGVIQADSSLTIPDYSAREKTYQQLHQIIGRVGRGHRAGHVVIQTYNPQSPVIAAAVNKDYATFLKHELEERKAFMYPPYCFMLKIVCSGKQEGSAEKLANDVLDIINSLKIEAQVSGPSPAFKYKTAGTYHWQLIVKSKQRIHLLTIIEHLPKNTRYDIDPVNLL